MEFSSTTIKNGSSKVGDFRMDYTVTYEGDDKVSKIDAQVKRMGEKAAEIHSGYVSFVVSTGRYLFQMTSNVTGDERKALFDDFEKTISELVK